MEFHILDLIFYIILCIPFIVWSKKGKFVSWDGALPFMFWFFMSMIFISVFWKHDVIDFFTWLNFTW